MKPYYQESGITIWNCDCREILPTLAPVDLVLTDPPYGIGEARGKNKSRSCIANSKDYGFSDWDDAPPSREDLDSIRRAAGKQIIFGGNYFELPPSSCWLIWDKVNGANDFADCELAWTNLEKAVRLFRYQWHGMLQQDMRRKEVRQHPTQKPVPLMRWCIGQAGDVSSLIDPYMGSGTTLRAAKDLGLKATGIERVERYCEAAANRLRQEVLQFNPEQGDRLSL